MSSASSTTLLRAVGVAAVAGCADVEDALAGAAAFADDVENWTIAGAAATRTDRLCCVLVTQTTARGPVGAGPLPFLALSSPTTLRVARFRPRPSKRCGFQAPLTGVTLLTSSRPSRWSILWTTECRLGTLLGVRVIVYLLIFGLAPGAAETFVDAAHTAINGHSPHSDVVDEGSDEHDQHDEHSCSALFHLCGCHAPAPTTTAARLPPPSVRWSEEEQQQRGARIDGDLLLEADGSHSRASRPPIA